ncbi:hypothetical protein SLEP1_g60176, partial [Rubroshorea leprosula]
VFTQGMSLLALSASVHGIKPRCYADGNCNPTKTESAVYFLALYLIALGMGGIKPCVSSYGADQFDDIDKVEKKQKSSFFNWFYFSINVGALIAGSVLVWVQENVSWGWGFGIPAIAMAIAVACFFSGTPLYRNQKPGGSPLTRMCQVLEMPMSIFWQVPQYFLIGCAEVFTFIGQLEFFYEQAPDAMRSFCSALHLTTMALGNYLSSLLVTIVRSVSTKNGKVGWIPENLNYGHLHYFFWLLTILSVVNLVVYLLVAKWYTYKTPVDGVSLRLPQLFRA